MKYYYELANMTNYANIYKLYDDQGRAIGTKQVVIAGCNCGVTFQTWDIKYKKSDIRKLFKIAIKKGA